MSEKKSNKREKQQNPNQKRKPVDPAPAPVIMEKLKILALHGYRQNEETFKSKLGSFRKFANRYCNIEFITAPHKAPPLLESSPKDQAQSDQRSWWFNNKDGTFKGTNQNGPAIGFQESLKLVEAVWKEKGPFHGLLGFSQGACFVGLLCSLSARGMTSIKPEFAIMSSGFRSGSLAHLIYYESIVEIPTLHIFGETDNIIPNDMSMMLSETFAEPEILVHPGGHYFPATAQQKQFFIRFLQNRLQDYLERKELEDANETNTIVIKNDEFTQIKEISEQISIKK